MPEALRYYLAAQLAAAAFLPFAARLFRRSPDRGWAFAKPLGIFAFALADRWLFAAGLVDAAPATRSRILLLLLLAAAGSRLLAPRRRRWLGALLSRRGRVVALIEATFAVAFAVGLLLRALDPGAGHTEQPMDLMQLANELDAPAWPPLDPWLAGVPVGYYTLGHAAAAALARLAAVPAEIAYNLALAIWFGLAVAGLLGVAFALAGHERRGGARRTALALPLAAPLVLLAANPAAVAAAAHRLAGIAAGVVRTDWWWWSASRLVVDEAAPAGLREMISEFPQFAFAVGDLHPHLLALPLGLVAAGLALALARARRLAALDFAGAALVAGAAVSTNSWDLPAILLLLAGGAALGADRAGARARRVLAVTAAALAGGAAVALPHLVVADAPITAMVVNTRTPSSPGELAALFGALAPGLTLLGALAFAAGFGARRRALAGAAAGALAAALLPALAAQFADAPGAGGLERQEADSAASAAAALAERGFDGALAAALAGGLAGGAATLAFARRRLTSGSEGPDLRGALALAAAGAALVAAPEIVFLRDTFGTRLNTLFKLHASAWPLLALAALAGGVAALRAGGRWRAGGALALAAVASGALYGGTIALERAIAAGPLSLDALAPLAASAPDEAAAIRWVRDFVPRDARLLEAPGESYRPEQSRISATTARATLLGWRNHELQWRGREAYARLAAGREAAAAEIYAGTSAAAKAEALSRWSLDFVLIGPVERARYDVSPAAELALAELAEPAFARGEITLWRLRGR